MRLWSMTSAVLWHGGGASNLKSGGRQRVKNFKQKRHRGRREMGRVQGGRDGKQWEPSGSEAPGGQSEKSLMTF